MAEGGGEGGGGKGGGGNEGGSGGGGGDGQASTRAEIWRVQFPFAQPDVSAHKKPLNSSVQNSAFTWPSSEGTLPLKRLIVRCLRQGRVLGGGRT